jgi:hypothetical protein
MSDFSPPTRPLLKLVGEDGNAFSILGRCMKAARRDGWNPQELDAFHAETTSGNYDHLLELEQACTSSTTQRRPGHANRKLRELTE